ncbi:response regulator [Dellaglioa sp. BT-FLS60]
MNTVMVVDDHPIVRNGLEMMINMNPQLTVVGVAVDGIDAQSKLAELDEIPDLILVDLRLPKMAGFDLIKQLAGQTRIVVLSTEIDNDVVKNMMNYGIRGYLLKSEEPAKIVDEVVRVLNADDYVAVSNEVTKKMMALNENPENEIKLTEKQIDLLKNVADGMTNKDIAGEMFVTDRTVKLYLTEIYETLNVTNRAQAIAVAVKLNLL